jgi:hypothetical protein
MSDLKNPNSEISTKINRATDIYILKKDELIKYCESKNLNSEGKSTDLRQRLSRFIKGMLKPDDIKNSVGKDQYNEIIRQSVEQKLDLEKLEKEAGLSESSPETIFTDKEIQKREFLFNQNESLKICENLNDSILSVSNKLDNILKISEASSPVKTEEISVDYQLINLDKSNNFSNNQNPISQNLIPKNTRIINSQKAINPEGNKNTKILKMDSCKYIVVKPDTFSGDEDVRKFFKQYEKAADVNSWSEAEKIKFLSVYIKGTASIFLENLERKCENLTWAKIKQEFLEEFNPIGYDTILKTELENRRQGESESVISFINAIENLCIQLDNNMSEKDICTYILRGLKENILHAISFHDNNNLKELKTNLKKYELMKYRINSRNPNINEYSEILNKQIMQLNKNANNRDDEINELKTQLNELKVQINNRGKTNKSVNFNNMRDRSYERETKYLSQKRDYRDKSPYPGRQNYRSRESSLNRQINRGRSGERQYYERRPREYNTDIDYKRENNYYESNRNDYRDKSPYTERKNYESRPREYSTDRDYKIENNYESNRNNYRDKSPYTERKINRNREDNHNKNDYRDYRNRSYSRNRDNYNYNSYRNQRSRDNSHERTPEHYRNDYEKQTERVTCYRCNEKGHYADKCTNQKND